MHVLNALQHGDSGIDLLARGWDDEQRTSGNAWSTRARRRRTLRSLVAAAVSNRLAPEGVTLDLLARDVVSRGPAHERIDDAISRALDRRLDRDAAILCLLWESAFTLAAVQTLRVQDLPLPMSECSDRCALALTRVAGERPLGAYVFAGRDARQSLDGHTIRETLARYGLPRIIPLRRARASRLRALQCHDNAPRVLAGES